MVLNGNLCTINSSCIFEGLKLIDVSAKPFVIARGANVTIPHFYRRQYFCYRRQFTYWIESRIRGNWFIQGMFLEFLLQSTCAIIEFRLMWVWSIDINYPLNLWKPLLATTTYKESALLRADQKLWVVEPDGPGRDSVDISINKQSEVVYH